MEKKNKVHRESSKGADTKNQGTLAVGEDRRPTAGDRDQPALEATPTAREGEGLGQEKAGQSLFCASSDEETEEESTKEAGSHQKTKVANQQSSKGVDSQPNKGKGTLTVGEEEGKEAAALDGKPGQTSAGTSHDQDDDNSTTEGGHPTPKKHKEVESHKVAPTVHNPPLADGDRGTIAHRDASSDEDSPVGESKGNSQPWDPQVTKDWLPDHLAYVVQCHECKHVVAGQKKFCILKGDDLQTFVRSRSLQGGLHNASKPTDLLPAADRDLVKKILASRNKNKKPREQHRSKAQQVRDKISKKDAGVKDPRVYTINPGNQHSWEALMNTNKGKFFSYCKVLREHYRAKHYKKEYPLLCYLEKAPHMKKHLLTWNSHADNVNKQIDPTKFAITWKSTCDQDVRKQVTHFALREEDQAGAWETIFENFVSHQED